MNTTDIAIQYSSWGWSILPVKPVEKRPYMMNWTEYNQKRANEASLRSWFDNLMNPGIGVVTGKISNIVVIDMDQDCPINLQEMLQKYPTGLYSITGSGGYHLFYTYPPGCDHVKNRVRIQEGVDIRADGGFIVLPPTTHKSGKQYKWLGCAQMGVFPMSLVEAVNSVKDTQEQWITELLSGVPQGGRNDAAARLCGYFFKKGIASDVIESLLVAWNQKNDPPMPISELRTTMASIQKSHAGVSTAQIVEFIDDTQTGNTISRDIQSVLPDEFKLLPMQAYIKSYGGNGVEWSVDKWLPKSSVTLMVSPPESYKTWILLDLAVSIATGSKFLDSFDVNTTGPVMIIQQEDSHAELTERLSLIFNERLDYHMMINNGEYEIPPIPDIPIYIHPNRSLRFDNKQVLSNLEKRIAEIKPAVIMIDPLYSAASTDNYMAGSAEQMMVLKTWRDKYDCSFVIAHHSKKNINPDSTAREDSWGSQFLNAFLEAGWQIRRGSKLGQNEVIVRRHSKTMGNQAPISLKFDISTVYPFKYHVECSEYTVTSDKTGVQNTLFELIKDKPMNQLAMATTLGKSKSTISRQLKQLEASGCIEKMPDGKYMVKEIEDE